MAFTEIFSMALLRLFVVAPQKKKLSAQGSWLEEWCVLQGLGKSVTNQINN
jgi:hypothetical protein